jgi:predicted metal-dependent hydrolase
MDPERKGESFWRGIECFNRRQFFTCHEVLEEIWLQEPPPQKPYYQGLIQVAAGFHHFQNGNLKGTRSLLRAGVEKLRRNPPDYHGIDVAGLLRALEPWLDRLARQQSLDGLALPTIEPVRPHGQG